MAAFNDPSRRLPEVTESQARRQRGTKLPVRKASTKEDSMALYKMTKPQLVSTLAEKVPGMSQAEARRFIDALEDTVNDNLANCIRTEVAGVVIEPKLRAASKARIGRNPQTGEEVPISAKPASVRVATRATKRLKEQAPTTQKLKRAL